MSPPMIQSNRSSRMRDDLADVAAIDGVDPLSGDGGGGAVELDADDAALLPLLERLAERRLAAAELEDRLRVRC